MKEREKKSADGKITQQNQKGGSAAPNFQKQESGLDLLGRLFYTPPKTLDEFIQAIRASLINEDPQMPIKALVARIQTREPSMTKLQIELALNKLDPK